MIIKTLKHAILPLALAVNLAACGGSGSSSKSNPNSTQETSSISGSATKGILKNAKVEVFKLVDGKQVQPAAATTSTDSAGKYSAKINYQGPALILISAQDGSMMTCDIAPDCGKDSSEQTITFGTDYPMPQGLTVKAVSNVANTLSVNPSPLTSLAAALAEARGFNKLAIAGANSQVADLFNISGNLTEADVVDITDEEAFKNADDNTQKVMALSSALYAAAKNKNKSLDELLTQFVENEGQFIGKSSDGNSPDVDLSEIYTKALAVLEKSDASNIDVAIKSAQDEAEKEEDKLTEAVPADDIINDDDLDKVKSMVSDIRTIATSASFEQSETFATELQAAGTLLSEDIDSSNTALRVASIAIVEVYRRIDDGGAQTGTFNQDVVIERAGWQYGGETWVEVPEKIATVEVTVDAQGKYNINQQIKDNDGTNFAKVDINVTANITSTNTDLEEKCTWEDTDNGYKETCNYNPDELTQTVNATLTINNAVVSNDAVKLTIEPKSKLTLKGSLKNSWAYEYQSEDNKQSESDTGYFHLNIETFQADLKTSIQQLAPSGKTDPVTITGNLKIEAKDLKIHADENDSWESTSTYTNDENTYSNQYKEVSTTEVKLQTASIGFTGSVSNVSNTIDVIFNASVKGSGLTFENKESEDYFYSDTCGDIYNEEQGYNDWICTESPDNKDIRTNENSSNETENNFAKVNFSLVTTAKLKGIADTARIELTGDRTALYKAKVNAKISYDGKSFDIAMPVNYNKDEETVGNLSTTITNHNGVKMHLTRDAVSKKITGSITKSGETYATIDDAKLHIVRYVDGTMESLE